MKSRDPGITSAAILIMPCNELNSAWLFTRLQATFSINNVRLPDYQLLIGLVGPINIP